MVRLENKAGHIFLFLKNELEVAHIYQFSKTSTKVLEILKNTFYNKFNTL